MFVRQEDEELSVVSSDSSSVIKEVVKGTHNGFMAAEDSSSESSSSDSESSDSSDSSDSDNSEDSAELKKSIYCVCNIIFPRTTKVEGQRVTDQEGQREKETSQEGGASQQIEAHRQQETWDETRQACARAQEEGREEEVTLSLVAQEEEVIIIANLIIIYIMRGSREWDNCWIRDIISSESASHNPNMIGYIFIYWFNASVKKPIQQQKWSFFFFLI